MSEAPPSIPRAGPGTALLLDAAGTLLHPAVPVAETYARLARAHGARVEVEEVAARFPQAMKQAAELRRGAPDWRPFWRVVVERSTGSDDPALLDALIDHFRHGAAWRLAEGAEACCRRVRAAGMKVAVVSNWDRGLRPLLAELGVRAWVDALAISAELGVEKPDPAIFAAACEALGVAPARAVHLGNDPDEDVAGARAAGCAALLLGRDLANFDELAARLLAAP